MEHPIRQDLGSLISFYEDSLVIDNLLVPHWSKGMISLAMLLLSLLFTMARKKAKWEMDYFTMVYIIC